MAPKPYAMDHPSPPPSREQQQQYIKNSTTQMNNNDNREQLKHRSGGRSSSRRQLANSMTNTNEGVGGSSSSSRQLHPTAAHQARQQQRRRPTNYTSSYTPSPELVAQHSAAKANNASSAHSTTSTSRRKCSSLDRSEEEGDARRRHLKSGTISKKHHPPSSSSSTQQQLPTVNEPYNEAASVIGGLSEQVQLRRDQLQLQAMQSQLRLEREQQQQQQLQLQSRGGGGGGGGGQGSRGGESSNTNNKGYERSGTVKSSGSSKNRRLSQDRGGSSSSSASGHNRHGSTSQRKSSSSSRRSSKESSSSSSNKHTTNNEGTVEDTSERAEQQRIEEYAGKRALLRLEQELADHSESNNRGSSRSLSRSKSPGNGGGYSSGGGGGGDVESYKSVMDRKKLARVPQVKKSDLIIGEYLGRGNFCDVFEVTWIPAEQRTLTSQLSSRTYSTYDVESDESNRSLENSMDSLALSCSNDLNLVMNDQRNGGLTRSASRRSVSQVVSSAYTSSGSGHGGGGFTGGMGGSSMMMNGISGLRNPNVLALKCLRPAVRAQPRKFVIGAEDLAHETALLACLDHPNIIQLYGRAEGCFSTAFQMRNKGSSSSNNDPPSSSSGGGGGSSSKGGGKQMSNEGYFIILDRLMTTLTDRNEEWKDECRAINGVGPPPATGLPPESTLREHLCKRLKVAYCIADALEYLHSRHVVFRDLKPANVGFDCNDCVKMFDFGFATSIAPLLSQPYEGYGPLTETCGTRRYMATEVALKLGYGKEVDVYSFGMLLWEICALDKPFDSIQSVDEFHDLVVLCGRRPSLNIDPLWTPSLKNLMSRCWSTDPLDRPTMVQVKSLLCNVLRDMNKAMEKSSSSGRSGVNGAAGGTGTQQQRQEQGGNFIHKWRRRVSI